MPAPARASPEARRLLQKGRTPMKVTFIYHSSYFVELDRCCLLFDYFRGEIPQVDKPLYVFASHSHPDHFSPAVFQLAQKGREVHYLLADDIPPQKVPQELRGQVTFTAPRAFYEIGELKAATLRSTDMGVAFLVQCEGKCIYHAGDLNCWVWDGAPGSKRPDAGRLPGGAGASAGQGDRCGLCPPGPPPGGGLRPGDAVLLRGRRGGARVPHAHVGGLQRGAPGSSPPLPTGTTPPT